MILLAPKLGGLSKERHGNCGRHGGPGLGFGANSIAALITRGLAEMTGLALA